jgi:hypothetical protein
MERYERMPEWLRWILFAPVTATLSLLALILYTYLRQDEFEFIQPAFVMLIPMYIVYLFAPRAKKWWALSAVLLRMAFMSVIVVSVEFIGGPEADDYAQWEPSYEILGYIVSLVVWYFFMHKKPIHSG